MGQRQTQAKDHGSLSCQGWGLGQVRLLAEVEPPKMLLGKRILGMGTETVQLPEDFSHILQTLHWIPPHRLWKT